MVSIYFSISSLLLGFSLLLVGVGLLGTLLGVRANLEDFSSTITGLVMSGYFIGFIVGTYYCPGIIHRVGHIRAFAAMAAAGAAAAFMHILVVEPFTWLLLRIITGICLVGMYMVVESWINSITPVEYRGRIFATYMMITLFAVAIGPYLIIIDGGKSTISFGIAAMLFTLGMLPVVLTKVYEPPSIPVPRIELKNLYRKSPLAIVGAMTSGLANSAFFGMGAVFAKQIELTEQGIALFMSLLILGGACLQWPVGHLSDHSDRRTIMAIVCLFAVLTALGTYLAVEYSMLLMYVCAFVYGGMAFSVYPLAVAHMNDHVNHSHFLEASRTILLMYGIGAVLGPLCAGILMQIFGPGALLLFFTGTYSVLGLYILYRQRVREPVAIEAQTNFTPMSRTSQMALNLHPEANNQPDKEST